MDLTQSFPRSPKETLAGLAHLPRMIDKIRARRMGRLGPYIYPCPMDKMVLGLLGLAACALAGLVEGASDEEIEKQIAARCLALGVSEKDKQALNHRILTHKPEPGEKQDYFIEQRNRIDPTRTDIVAWAALSDLEEGRRPLAV